MQVRYWLFLLNSLLPVVPVLIVGSSQKTGLFSPWVIVGFMFGLNLVLSVMFWRRIGFSVRRRREEVVFLLLSSFVPFFAYRCFLVSDSEPYSLAGQTAIYCICQAIWFFSVGIGPGWIGRIRQRRAEERALSGREKVFSRKKMMEEK